MAGGQHTLAPRLRARMWKSAAGHAVAEAQRFVRRAPRGPECVLLVMGCQRSGTTLMTRLLDRDPDAKIYPEHSALSARDKVHGLRLDALDRVRRRTGASRFPLVVLKPLVESQNAARLLAAWPEARVLWMFRHWTDVARSNLDRFGDANGLKNLRFVAERIPSDWRSEGVSEHVHDVVKAHFHEAMSALDAAALFWWARNALFFEQDLGAHPRVDTCRYEELVADPARVMGDLYAGLGRSLPDALSLGEVSTSSVGRAAGLAFSPDVAKLCDATWERLVETHEGDAACA